MVTRVAFSRAGSCVSASSPLWSLLPPPRPSADPVPFTVDNFIRAESDLYMKAVAIGLDGFGKFDHKRKLAPINDQTVIRENRDTLPKSAAHAG